MRIFLLALLLLMACNAQTPTPLERIQKAFELMEKAGHFRIW